MADGRSRNCSHTEADGAYDTRYRSTRKASSPDALNIAAKKYRDYPRYARQREWEGRATIRLDIGANGRAQQIRVTKSTGVEGGFTVDGAEVTVTLDPTDTAQLSGVYGHEMQITDVAGHVYTALRGQVSIAKDVIV